MFEANKDSIVPPVDGLPLIQSVQYYLVDTATEGVTYRCYTNNASRLIERVTVATGLTTTEKAFGDWEDRADLTYVPINALLS